MNGQTHHLPEYASPLEALETEMARWGEERLDIASTRYGQLRGKLPERLGAVGIAIVDETERPDAPGPLEMYGRQGMHPQQFGALVLVNYEGTKPSARAARLADIIERRSAAARVSTAVLLEGYDELRKVDRLRTDVWDVAARHVLENRITHQVVGISSDFDVSGASAGYFGQMTENEYVDRPAHMWGGRYKFERPGKPDSPMNRLLDYLSVGRTLFPRFQNSAVIYGGNMALTMQTYALAGSWQHPAYPNEYGAFEDVKILLNLWERYTGQPATEQDATPARAALFHWLEGNYVEVPPRREVYAFAHNLGDPQSMGRAFTTRLDNPIRSLTSKELDKLSDSVRADDPMYRQHLDAFDAGWLKILHKYDAEVKAVLRQARNDLALPLPGFDTNNG